MDPLPPQPQIPHHDEPLASSAQPAPSATSGYVQAVPDSAPVSPAQSASVPVPGPVPDQTASKQTFELLAAGKGTQPWLVAAMRQHFQVPEGREFSAEDFDKMATQVSSLQIGVLPPTK